MYESSKQELIDSFKKSKIVFMAPGRYLDDEIHDAGAGIRLFQLWSSGYDKLNLHKIKELQIAVSNNGGANKYSVAEHTLLLMLASARRFPEMHKRVVTGDWEGNGHGMNLKMLKGNQLGIIGLGAIGTEVAKLSKSFGMNVGFYDIAPKKQEATLLDLEPLSLDNLLMRSDFISIHTHATQGYLLDRNALNKVKNGAIIINTSRASLIDTNYVQTLLSRGKLNYYGADVFDFEPTIGTEPILKTYHGAFTPHIAGSNPETYKIALENCIANIKRVQSGQEPLWRVN
jgi:lactate dehydrogenase-like 2-hydroxyacid dehydrogenase